jgi:NADH:ubiquinone reductase (H+-translocating)
VAPGLKRIEDATRIRRRILIAFERAELATDAAERQRLLTFAIVGGGPTGVEMAGAISEVARQSLAMDFRRIDPAAARIVLIEAGPRIMPTLPENLSNYVRRTLSKKGVEVITSTRVMSCAAHGVELEHGRLDADTVIWAAGVVASPAARWLDAEHDRAGKVKVGADLSVPSHPDVFVIGDTAAVTDQPGIPGTAPAAKQIGGGGKPLRDFISARMRVGDGATTPVSVPTVSLGARSSATTNNGVPGLAGWNSISPAPTSKGRRTALS